VPITSAVRTPDGGGYWILAGNGDVYGYGDARSLGGPSGLNGFDYASSIVSTSDGQGYWIVTSLGGVDPYGDATDEGDLLGTTLNAPVIAASGW
jgi:hypothetical protein